MLKSTFSSICVYKKRDNSGQLEINAGQLEANSGLLGYELTAVLMIDLLLSSGPLVEKN